MAIVTDADLLFFLAGEDPVLYNILRRKGYTVARLADLRTEESGDYDSWHDLLDVRLVGRRRLLRLVNFFRNLGEELPWFYDFDTVSANWPALRGYERSPVPEYSPSRPADQAPVSTQPPPGCIALGKLIECLRGTLDEEAVDEHTLVRVAPEFGQEPEPMFTSGVGISYPAGQGWDGYQPWITIEYRRQGLRS
jgi:hypothetical protein